MGAFSLTDAALGHKVKDSALAVLVSGVPVLDRGVLYIGPFLNNYLHNGGVKLLLVTHWGGAAFHIGEVGVFVGHNESALKLAGAARVDAEITGEFHGAADTPGDVAEGTVGENRAVKGRKVVVAGRYNACEVLTDKVRVLFHGLGETAEDDAFFCQGFPESGSDGDGVEHRIHGHNAGKNIPLFQGNTKFIEGFGKFGVYLLGTVLVLFGSGKVDDVLVVDFRHIKMRPVRLGHLFPFTKIMAISGRARIAIVALMGR